METNKFKKRVSDLSDDIPIVIEIKGVFYNILTAKVLRNQIRKGPELYFSVIASKEVKKEDIGK